MVDWKWMKQWKKYVGFDPRHRSHSVGDYGQQDMPQKGQPSAHPGPVDNADLFLPTFSTFIPQTRSSYSVVCFNSYDS